MTLVRMLRGGQVTLPADARRALRLREGDYLDLAIDDGVVMLKPVTVVDRVEADRKLGAILGRVEYAGPQPEPDEDAVMGMVVEEIHAARTGRAQGRSR